MKANWKHLLAKAWAEKNLKIDWQKPYVREYAMGTAAWSELIQVAGSEKAREIVEGEWRMRPMPVFGWMPENMTVHGRDF